MAAGAPALTTAQEEDLQVEELIKCKLELANFKDECDKLHQTNGNLERKLAQAKMELANAKEKQDDAEVQRDHALIMQQTALQELNSCVGKSSADRRLDNSDGESGHTETKNYTTHKTQQRP